MNDSSLRTITLDSESLEAAISALSSAAASFSLTRRERIGYRALMISVDCVIATLAIAFMTLGIMAAIGSGLIWFFLLIGLGLAVFLVSIVAGVLAFVLNLPLLRRMREERARLKALGVGTLSQSLWKASRRHDWLSRIRGALIVIFGVLIVLLASVYVIEAARSESKAELLVAAVFCLVVAITLFGARHLRNLREQMDLAANAVELQKALQNLRQQTAATGTIDVPAELVERAAGIESAQIARNRKEAILQSAVSLKSGYAIAFEDRAAEQRAALDVTDRLELEDLLAELSTASHGVLGHGARSRSATQSERVEVEYAVDEEARVVRVTAVHRVPSKAGSAMAEADDA